MTGFCHEMNKHGGSCNFGINPTLRAYQIKEQTGKNPTAFKKPELDGVVIAVSGRGNRAIVQTRRQFEIHDIGQGVNKLVCQTEGKASWSICALNEDGSEAAFVNDDGKLRIVEVGKADQPAIVSVQKPESQIYRLIYTDGGKLHLLHDGGKVSLFDRLTKKLVLLEGPQEGQKFMHLEISPNADYIVILQGSDEGEKSRRVNCRTIVKRKLGRADLEGLFGCKADKDE